MWASFLVLTGVLILVYRHYATTDVWAPWTAGGNIRSEYAERIVVASVFRTRANTWSNLAYVLAGFYALAFAYSDSRRTPPGAGYLVRTPAFSALFGIACVYLGIGSGLFHASLTRWGQQLDVASMYPPMVVLIAVGLGRFCPRLGSVPTWPLLTVVTVALAVIFYVYKWQMKSSVVLPLLIAILGIFPLLDLLVIRRWRVNRLYYPAGMAAIVAAVVCRQMDVAHRFSGPDDWWQGHAFWHILAALALWLSYLHFRSEKPILKYNMGTTE